MTEFVDRPIGEGGAKKYTEERIALMETLKNGKALLYPWRTINSLRQTASRTFPRNVRVRTRKKEKGSDVFYVWLEKTEGEP